MVLGWRWRSINLGRKNASRRRLQSYIIVVDDSVKDRQHKKQSVLPFDQPTARVLNQSLQQSQAGEVLRAAVADGIALRTVRARNGALEQWPKIALQGLPEILRAEEGDITDFRIGPD